jgi:hypothetical protein
MRCQVVDLIWLGLLQDADERGLVEQVAGQQGEPVTDVLDAAQLRAAAAAEQAADAVAIVQQQSARCEPSCPLMPVLNAVRITISEASPTVPPRQARTNRAAIRC